MKLVTLLVCCCLVGLTAASLPPVNGTARIRLDFTGFSSDVTVSVCEGSHTYNSQGGAVRDYTVQTVNAPTNCQLVIMESAARVAINVTLQNGANIVFCATGQPCHRANLTLHLENYNPATVGNTFAVRLRADVNGQPNIFREYADVGLPALATRLPTSVLGLPQPVAVYVPVLNTAQPITVWVGENHKEFIPAAWVVCHTGVFQTTDSNCADGLCDSGRCIAHLQVPLACDEPFDFPFQSTNDSLYWTPSASTVPVTLVREFVNLPSAIYQWFVLASDVWQLNVNTSTNGVDLTEAANCYSGKCEFLPITSVLTADVCSLSGDVRVTSSVGYSQLFVGVNSTKNRLCVLNHENTLVSAQYYSNSTGVVRKAGRSAVFNIDCRTTDQVCAAKLCNTLTPNWGCLGPNSMVEPNKLFGIKVVQRSNLIGGADEVTWWAWSHGPATIDVPAVDGLILRVSEGTCDIRPKTPALEKEVNTCLIVDYPITDCTNGPCQTDRVGRVLTLFDLAYLPENTDVSLLTPLGNGTWGVYAEHYNQGGDPQCYCTFAAVIRARLLECQSEWTSEDTSCVVARDQSPDDCSMCDFLSILTVDLVGLPRETGATISTGLQYGTSVTLIEQDFNSFHLANCQQDVNGTRLWPNWYTWYPQSETLRVWQQGCSGAPARDDHGLPTGNTLRVGYIAPPAMRNSTCVRVQVPDGMSELNINFLAWSHDNSNNSLLHIVRSRGLSSGVNTFSYINVASDTWTANTQKLLLVQQAELVEVCFVTDMRIGLQIDDVEIIGQAYPVYPCRDEAFVGNRVNNFVVLRSGSGTGIKQRYCITVVDGAASKMECVVCDSKTCIPETPFVCKMCLDLASPNNLPGIENRLTIDLSFNGNPVRTITSQGGTNGCANKKRAAEVEAIEQQLLLEEEALERRMGITRQTVNRLSRAEVKAALAEVAEQMKAKRAQFENLPPQQSRYSVLCVNYNVCASERTLGPKCVPVDCTFYGNCSGYHFLVDASVDLACQGNPPAAGQLPSNNVDLTIYDTSARFDRNGVLVAGNQVRGLRSPVLLNPTNCTFSPETWISASYQNVGGSIVRFPVLCVDLQIRVDEHPVVYNRSVYPDPLQHPFIVHDLDCSPGASCKLAQGDLLSLWSVQSQRGLPGPGRNAFIKFGDNSQNNIRFIGGSLLAAPDANMFCVIADNRPWYVFLWDTWSSKGANLPFDDCSHNTSVSSVNAPLCRTSVVVPPNYK